MDYYLPNEIEIADTVNPIKTNIMNNSRYIKSHKNKYNELWNYFIKMFLWK